MDGSGGVVRFLIVDIRHDPRHVLSSEAHYSVAGLPFQHPTIADFMVDIVRAGAIFWLTVFVMLVGFALIGVGISLLYVDSRALDVSVLSTVSGVIVSFVGATFLTMYKSSMTQAAEYVAILERINAVGMSVQILETTKQDDRTLKADTTAEIAKQLLVMYSDKGKT